MKKRIIDYKTVLQSLKQSPERQFFLLCAAWFVFIVLLGFGRTFYFNPNPVPPYKVSGIYFHAMTLTLWLIIYVVQNLLIASRSILWHKRLGMLSMILLFLILLSSYRLILVNDSFLNVVLNLQWMTIGVVAAYVAIAYRKKPYNHKRIMLFAMAFLMSASSPRAAVTLGQGYSLNIVPWLNMVPLIALFLFDVVSYKRIKFLSSILLVISFVVNFSRPYRLLDTEWGHSMVEFLINVFGKAF